MRKLLTALLLSLTMVSGAGCATMNIPAIIAAVMDAEMILSNIASFVDSYFKLKPNAADEQKIADAIARTRTALDMTLRLTQGAQKVEQAQIDAAFADFKMAYADLMKLLWPLGVSMQGNTFKAIPGGLVVPEPMALTLKAAR